MRSMKKLYSFTIVIMMVLFYSCKSYQDNVTNEVADETNKGENFTIKTNTHITPSSLTGNSNSNGNGEKGSKPKK